jgi:hypothetical protein
MSHNPECCFQLPSFGERGWQATDLAQELQGAGGVAAATQTITIQTNRPVLLGRLELEYEDTVFATTVDNQGLLVAGLPLIASQGGSDLSCFKPDAPGMTDANYLGVALFPQQTMTIRAAFTGGNSRMSARVLCRPLSDAEADYVQSSDPFVAGYRLLYGMPVATIAPGPGQLIMTVERPIQAGFNLGMLVLAALSTVGKFDLEVTSITVAGVAVDQEVVQASVAWTHFDFTNARGRGLRLKSQLGVGARVIINLNNTTGAPIAVAGAFIRTPDFGSALSGGKEATERPVVLDSDALLPRQGGAVMPGVTRSSYLSPTGASLLQELRQRPKFIAGLNEEEQEDMAEAITFIGGDDPTVKGTIMRINEGKLSPQRALGSLRKFAQGRGAMLPSVARSLQGGNGRR